jgi:hypothetical protein
MTEMVFAIFILGLGLLFTSSMFPIAWFKAREVAEVTTAQSSAAAGRDAFMRVAKINNESDLGKVAPDTPSTAFFENDWTPAIPGVPLEPLVFPNTRVHALNLANYLAEDRFAIEEQDDIEGGSALMPVADNSWRLSDQLAYTLGNNSVALASLWQSIPVVENRIYVTKTSPQDRLVPQMNSVRPNPIDTAAVALWDEQFEGRRYCWSVLYRFSDMYGPDPDPNWAGPPIPIQNNPTMDQLAGSLKQPRSVTAYYVTLKRPDEARYARQVGIDGSSGVWNSSSRMHQPRALPSNKDVLMPSPWRVKASLVTVPDYGVGVTGIPSEIRVNDIVLANMLSPKTILIDDRNGQVYRITQRRDTNDQAIVVLGLDKEYSYRDIYLPRHETFPANDVAFEENWTREWEWEKLACDELDLNDTSDPIVNQCRSISVFGNSYDDLRKDRYYWVFPPPVEAVRAGTGVPIFAGSPPVVDIETRQVVLRPRM